MDFDIKLLIGIWWAIQEINCQVNWILDTTVEPDHEPLIGKNVRLNCTATGCCANAREWSVDISGTYSVVLIDGSSNNLAKYEEDLQASANQFNLIIKNFQESDLKKYKCRYQFNEDEHTLLMTDGLHYLPSESDMTEVMKVFSSSTNTFSYTLNITSVYPDPSCTASYGGDDLTSSMTKTVTDNGNFKSVLLQFSNVAHSCSGIFIIQCTVGSYSNQQFANFEPCLIAQTSTEIIEEKTTTTNIIDNHISRSTPVHVENVTQISDILMSMTSQLDTGIEINTIISANKTAVKTIQTSNLSIRSFSADQITSATSSENPTTNIRTLQYVHESPSSLMPSSESSVSSYELPTPYSLNETNYVFKNSISETILFESTRTQNNILFTTFNFLSSSLQIEISGIGLMESTFEISNPLPLNTFSSTLDTEFIHGITTILNTNSYFVTDSLFSSNDGSLLEYTNSVSAVMTSESFFPSFSSSGYVLQKETDDTESYFTKLNLLSSTYGSFQNLSDTFEKTINTNINTNMSSYLLKSIQLLTISALFQTVTDLEDEEIIISRERTTSFQTFTKVPTALFTFQPTKQYLPTGRSEYLVTTIATGMTLYSSILASEIKIFPTKTSSNLKYTTLHISETEQSIDTSKIKRYSVMQSSVHYDPSDLDLMSSYFATSFLSTDKPPFSDRSTFFTSTTHTFSMSNIKTEVNLQLNTTNSPTSATQAESDAEQGIESSILTIDSLKKTAVNLSELESMEVKSKSDVDSFPYTKLEASFHESSLFFSSSSRFLSFTSDLLAQSSAPASEFSSTTSTVLHNEISERTKDIIVISSVSTIICVAVLILLISLFVKMHPQKNKKRPDIEVDDISYSLSKTVSNKKVLQDSLYTGESLIYPRLNTTWYSDPHLYKHNWEDI